MGWGNIRGLLLWMCMLLPIATGAGWSKTEYLPDIRLAQARPIIDATAELHDVYLKPALISGKESFGLTGPDAKQIAPNELADRVEAELLEAFDQAGVFTKITTFDQHPDLIVTGRIDALYEHYRPRIWTKIPYVGKVADVLDWKTHVSSGEADLTLFLLNRKGELVGTYRGISTFKENFNPTGEVAPGARLNRALTEAVQMIQDQMLRDAHLRTVASR